MKRILLSSLLKLLMLCIVLFGLTCGVLGFLIFENQHAISDLQEMYPSRDLKTYQEEIGRYKEENRLLSEQYLSEEEMIAPEQFVSMAEQVGLSIAEYTHITLEQGGVQLIAEGSIDDVLEYLQVLDIQPFEISYPSVSITERRYEQYRLVITLFAMNKDGLTSTEAEPWPVVVPSTVGTLIRVFQREEIPPFPHIEYIGRCTIEGILHCVLKIDGNMEVIKENQQIGALQLQVIGDHQLMFTYYLEEVSIEI